MPGHDAHGGQTIGQHDFQFFGCGIDVLALLLKKVRVHVHQAWHEEFVGARNGGKGFGNFDFAKVPNFADDPVFDQHGLVRDADVAIHGNKRDISDGVGLGEQIDVQQKQEGQKDNMA